MSLSDFVVKSVNLDMGSVCVKLSGLMFDVFCKAVGRVVYFETKVTFGDFAVACELGFEEPDNDAGGLVFSDLFEEGIDDRTDEDAEIVSELFTAVVILTETGVVLSRFEDVVVS